MKKTDQEKIRLVKKIIHGQKCLTYPEFNLFGLAVFKKLDEQELANHFKIPQKRLKSEIDRICLKVFNFKEQKNEAKKEQKKDQEK